MTVSMRLGFVNSTAPKEERDVGGTSATVVAYKDEAEHNLEYVSLYGD